MSGLDRSLWPEATVAAVAAMAVAWPLTELLRENTWFDGALLMVLLIGLLGCLLRALGISPSLLVGLQGLAAVYAILWRYLPETLWWGLPTSATLQGAGGLLREAGQVLRTYAAPAPTTEGVTFLVVLVIALTALSVDSIAVTGRSPAAAGIPLAAGFLVSVSNTGVAMAPQYFIAVAVAWLVMMAQQGDRLVGGWSSADRREAVGSRDVSRGPTGHRTVARVIGLVTVAAALVGASVLPHLPPTYLAEGLARNPEGRSIDGEGGTVSFTETMDPSQDLNSRSNAPVLTYRTSAQVLDPLRVTSSSRFEDGRWEPPDYDGAPADSGNGSFEASPGQVVAEEVPRDVAEVTVSQNAMKAPFLALPSPPVSAQLGVPWELDGPTGAVRVEEPPRRYESSYLQVAGRGELPRGIGDQPADVPWGEDLQEEYLRVDGASEEAIAALADEVVGGAENDLEVANRIQNHLRGGLYVYSLELVPNDDDEDPITHFLQTRQGYCVQFATAMVMMARHEGIPSRMAIGFLPGTLQADGSRLVLAADAHTWPELYIDGLGWTRFEPTPGIRTGQPPAYTQDAGGTAEPDPTAGETTEELTVTAPDEAGGSQDQSWWDGVVEFAPGLARTLVVLLVLAGLMAIVPWAGRRHREAGLRQAQSDADQVEGQWLLLTRSLEDFGVEPPEQRSPRAMRTHYASTAVLDRRSNEALDRVTATLERSRYAAPGTQDPQAVTVMGRDVRAVVGAVQDRLPWNIRTNAWLLPRSGLNFLRERVRKLFRRQR